MFNVIFIAQHLPLYERQNVENSAFLNPKITSKNNNVWSYFHDATMTVLMMLRHFTTFLYWDLIPYYDLRIWHQICKEKIFFIVIMYKTRPRHPVQKWAKCHRHFTCRLAAFRRQRYVWPMVFVWFVPGTNWLHNVMQVCIVSKIALELPLKLSWFAWETTSQVCPSAAFSKMANSQQCSWLIFKMTHILIWDGCFE